MFNYWPKPDLNRTCNSAPPVALCLPNLSVRKASDHSISCAKTLLNGTANSSVSNLINSNVTSATETIQECSLNSQNNLVSTQLATTQQHSPYLISDTNTAHTNITSMPNLLFDNLSNFYLTPTTSSLFNQNNSEKVETQKLIANFIPIAKTPSSFTPFQSKQQLGQLSDVVETSTQNFNGSLPVNSGLLEYILKNQQQLQIQQDQQKKVLLSALNNNASTSSINANNKILHLDALKNELLEHQILQLQQLQQQQQQQQLLLLQQQQQQQLLLLKTKKSTVGTASTNFETTVSNVSTNQLQNFVQALNESLTQSQQKHSSIELNKISATNNQLTNFNDATTIPGIIFLYLFFITVANKNIFSDKLNV